MVSFLNEQNQFTNLFLSPPENVVPRSRTNQDNEAEDLVLHRSMEPEEAASVASGETPYTPGIPDSYSILDEMTSSDATPEEISEALIRNEQLRNEMARIRNYSAVGTDLIEDPLVAANIIKVYSRAEQAHQRLTDLMESFSPDSIAGDVLEFVDSLVYETGADIGRIGSRISGEGGYDVELQDRWLRALNSFNDDEFENFVQERIDFLSSGGWHGAENDRLVAQEIAAIYSLGDNLEQKEWDQFWGILDVADIGIALRMAASPLVRGARSTVGRLRTANRSRAATRAAERAYEVPTANPAAMSRVMDDSLPSTHSSHPASTDTPNGSGGVTPATNVVSAGRVNQTIRNNRFIDEHMYRDAGRGFGASSIFDDVRTWATQRTQALRTSYNNSVVDISTNPIKEAPGVYTHSALLGTRTGNPYKSLTAAQKKADSIPGAQVVDANTGRVADSSSTSFYVNVQERFKTSSVTAPIQEKELALKTWLGRLFGSSALKTPEYFTNLASSMQAGSQGMRRRAREMLKTFNKLGTEDAVVIDQILLNLRDEADAARRTWYTPQEVAQRYNQITGKEISNKALEAYELLVEMSDYAWWTQASKRQVELANAGVVMADTPGGLRVALIPHDMSLPLPEGAVVADLSTGSTVTSWRGVVYKLQTRESDVTHVVNVGGTTVPSLEDAFPYNPGGFRDNPDIRWFVGGMEGQDYWRTLIGAKTERDAATTVTEFNNITSEIVSKVGLKGNRDDINSLSPKAKAEIEAVLRANNSWNPDLDNLDDYLDFLEARNISPTESVRLRSRDVRMTESMVGGDNTLVNTPLSQFVRMKRQDMVLMEYGGVSARNPNPITSIARRFDRSLTKGAETYYRIEHPGAWVQSLRKHHDNPTSALNLKGFDPSVPMTDEAMVRNVEIHGSTDIARKLRQEQEIILRRLDSSSGTYLDSIGNRLVENTSRQADHLVEAVYNSKVASRIDSQLMKVFSVNKGFTGDAAKRLKEFTIDEASARLMTLGFIEKMMSVDQMFLQGSHALNIAVATTVSTRNGWNSILMAAFLRKAAHNPIGSTWGRIAERLGKFSGLTKAQIDDLVEHLNVSGRGYMRGAVADDPSAATLRKSLPRKLIDIGSSPFYWGEEFGSTVARITAYLDTVAKHPNLATNSTEFLNKVVARDRALTMSLQGVHKSRAQTDQIGRIIGQWSSHQMRFIETVIFDKTLSPAERLALAGSYTAMYGAAGFGLYETATYLLEGSEVDEETKTLLLRGPIDWLLDKTVGISMSPRLAPLNGSLDRILGFAELDLVESIPVINLARETTERLYWTLRSAFHGSSILGEPFWMDAGRLARVLKIVDGPTMAYYMLMEDVRYNNSGSSLEANWRPAQIFAQAMGFSPTEAIEFSQSSSLTYNNHLRMDRAYNDSLNYFRDGIERMAEGDYEGAAEFVQTVGDIVDAYGFSSVNRAEVMDRLINNVGRSKVNMVIENLMKMGLQSVAANIRARVE